MLKYGTRFLHKTARNASGPYCSNTLSCVVTCTLTIRSTSRDHTDPNTTDLMHNRASGILRDVQAGPGRRHTSRGRRGRQYAGCNGAQAGGRHNCQARQYRRLAARHPKRRGRPVGVCCRTRPAGHRRGADGTAGGQSTKILHDPARPAGATPFDPDRSGVRA